MSASYHMLSAPAAPAPTAMHRSAVKPIIGWMCPGAIMMLTCLPLVFATAVPEAFVFAALAGTCIAPQITVRNNLATRAVSAGTATEAFTWLSLASTIGASAGAAAVGPLVEAEGWRAGAICAAVLPGVATLILFLRRDLLTSAPANPTFTLPEQGESRSG